MRSIEASPPVHAEQRLVVSRAADRYFAASVVSPCLTATVGAIVIGVTGVRGADYPAHLLRAVLWDRAGASIWNNYWYGGHPTPAYSIIVPPMTALVGPFLVGAASSLLATWSFARLASSLPTSRWSVAAIHLFALGSTVNLIVGRTPFAVGLALAMWTLSAWRRGRRTGCIVLAVLVPLASPVAATFLSIASAAWLVDVAVMRWRPSPDDEPRQVGTAAGVFVGSTAPLVLMAALVPAPGRYPFRGDQMLLSVGLMALVAALTSERLVRIGACIAAVASVVLFAVPNPLGGNFLRFTHFAVVPVAMLAFGSMRRRSTLPFIALIAFVAFWSLQFGVKATVAWSGDESTTPEYHAPLIDEVRERNADGPVGRLEIPFTENHWEAYFVASELPFARGWERQVDLERNPELYDVALTADAYRAWLGDHAVRWVAVPDVEFDDGGRPEAALITSGAASEWLTPVWRNDDWRLYEVASYQPLVDAPAQFVGQTPDEIVIRTPGPATVTVRFVYDDGLTIAPAGSVARDAGGWMRVEMPQGGTYTLRIGPGSLIPGG